MEDWNAVSKQRAIDDYLDKHRIYCKDCDNLSEADSFCHLFYQKMNDYDFCSYGTRKVEHVGRSNDTTGIADNTNNDNRMDNQPLICSHPCMDSTCKHHPISAPIDGTECRYIDLFRTEGCEKK